MSLKTKILKVLLWAATLSSPAMAQQGEKHSETDGKYFKTEMNFPEEIDGQEVYLAGLVTFGVGLDQETLDLVAKDNKDNGFTFVSDNGLVVFVDDLAIGVVVKNGNVSYVSTSNRRDFHSLTDEYLIDCVNKFVKLHAKENSAVYKAIYKHANTQSQQKKTAQDGVWHAASNRVGKIKYKFEKGTFIVDESSTFNYVRLPRPDIQHSNDGYYFIGDGMCKSMNESSVWPSYWAHMNSVWVHYGVVLDLKEREKTEVLSVAEYEFIQRFEKTIKQYGLALDANNNVVLSEQILEKSNNVQHFRNDMSR